MTGIDFKGLKIGQGLPCFIIAEAGVNHNGDLKMALDLVDAAKEAGADAVKFQTFVTEEVITRHSPKANYHIATTGRDEEQTWFDLIKSEELPPEAFTVIKEHCEKRGIIFMSTPYDVPSVELLDRLDVKAYKVASTDTNNLRLLEVMARTGRPIIISCGMCTMDEVRASIDHLRKSGCSQIVLTHCTAEYPAPMEDSNLRAMVTMARELGVAAGYSDHVPGHVAALGAVALGACLYECHFTLDKTLPGPDHRASREPAELAELIREIRALESALGDGIKRIMPSEAKNRPILRKYVVAAHDLAAGTVLAAGDVNVKRTGGRGIPADQVESVVGRTLACNLDKDEFIGNDALV